MPKKHAVLQAFQTPLPASAESGAGRGKNGAVKYPKIPFVTICKKGCNPYCSPSYACRQVLRHLVDLA